MRFRVVPALFGLVVLASCAPSVRAVYSVDDVSRSAPELRLGSDRPAAARYVAALNAAEAATRDDAFDILALSGGGAEGAFGAGLLTGWGQNAARPTFEVVTGVSTGALMAPFAFIGADGDAELTAAFTDGRSRQLLRARWLMALRGPGLFQQQPLRRVVEAAVTADLIQAVAHAHGEGRRLYVATTSLDTQRQVVWDLGALAASGRADARDRFIDILVASSSIPGVFQPVFIDLDGQGPAAPELHADGRTTANFFVVPEDLLLSRDLFGPAPPARPRRLWVVLNGRPEPAFSVAAYDHLAIAGRGLDAMMKASTRMNVIATRRFAEANGLEFFLAMAPAGSAESSLDFRPAHMRALFDAGEHQGRSGEAWAAGVVD